MNEKHRPGSSKMLLLATAAALIAASALSGCGAKTPTAQCYAAAGTLEVTQVAIKEVVTMPELEGTKAKTTLKQFSQTGTDAAKACLAAVKSNDGDVLAQQVGIINGVVQVGGQLAKDILAKELQKNISRAPARFEPGLTDELSPFMVEANTGPGDEEGEALAAHHCDGTCVHANRDTATGEKEIARMRASAARGLSAQHHETGASKSKPPEKGDGAKQ